MADTILKSIKFEGIDKTFTIPSVTVDSALSSTSENPVQNKVVKTAIDGKQDIITENTDLAARTIVANYEFAAQDEEGNVVEIYSTGMSFMPSTASSASLILELGANSINFGAGTEPEILLKGIAEPVDDTDGANRIFVLDSITNGLAGKQDIITDETHLTSASINTPYVAIGGTSDYIRLSKIDGESTINIMHMGGSGTDTTAKITGIANPTNDNDVANKAYVDTNAIGLKYDKENFIISPIETESSVTFKASFGDFSGYVSTPALIDIHNTGNSIGFTSQGRGCVHMQHSGGDPILLYGIETPLSTADNTLNITEADLPYQAVNKKYVDDLVGDINTILATIVEVTE